MLDVGLKFIFERYTSLNVLRMNHLKYFLQGRGMLRLKTNLYHTLTRYKAPVCMTDNCRSVITRMRP